MAETEKRSAWLLDHASDTYSQTGEDGIIEKILEHIPQKDRWCVEFGTWDKTNRTFTSLTGINRNYANAMRITARRLATRGTAVPVFFGRALGVSSCDVQATAIAMAPDTGYGVIGLDYIKMSGNTTSSRNRR